MVLNMEDICVQEDECPCLRNGIMYRHTEHIYIGCTICTCNNQKWNCIIEEGLSTCVLYGEGHYTTFDNRRYIFNGNCEYSLAQDFCGSSANGTFRVITENIPCGTMGTTCSKTIKVFVDKCILILTEGRFKEVGCTTGQVPYTVQQRGIFLLVEINIGLILIWDKKTRIIVKLTKKYKNAICGLCGNYDGDGNNDFITRNQALVGNALEFGNSWKISPECADATEIPDPCVVNSKMESLASKDCSLITSEVFSACHSQVNPKPYFEACLSDTCACNTGGDCDCFCTAVAAYAQACSEACICVHWRTPDICPLFCDYYNYQEGCEWHYKPCGHPCLKTCRNLEGTCAHELPGLEGCYPNCPPDRPFLEETSMKCVAQCGCYDEDGVYYKPGEKVPSCENCQICNCTVQGIKCNYYVEACLCVYNGKIYKYKELVYQMTDSMGGCINATCGANGTLDTIKYTCPTTLRTTTSQPSTPAPSSTGSTKVSTPAPPCVYVHEVCAWSNWFDTTNPSNSLGDFETVENLKTKGITVCKAPSDVQCRATLFPDTPIKNLNQKVQCTTSGLVCYNDDQNLPGCLNYEVRFLCCSYEPCDGELRYFPEYVPLTAVL
ncbi:mucin-5B-like [Ambystoma mexicanum]|uniref:mucin-5B-like n=1 Tax=Ambystoma mexicanum TaxID=8296 RepID=UPI0037E7F203